MKERVTENLDVHWKMLHENPRKTGLKILKVVHDSVIFGRRAYFCFEKNKYNNFRREFPKSRKKQISFRAAAEFRFESSRFSRCLIGTSTWHISFSSICITWNILECSEDFEFQNPLIASLLLISFAKFPANSVVKFVLNNSNSFKHRNNSFNYWKLRHCPVDTIRPYKNSRSVDSKIFFNNFSKSVWFLV